VDAFFVLFSISLPEFSNVRSAENEVEPSTRAPEFDSSARRNRYAAFEINDLGVNSGFSCGGTF